jgi:hypothetical protein
MAANSYDFRNHPELVALAEEITAALPLDVKEDFRVSCEEDCLRIRLQVPPLNPDCCEIATLQEMADFGHNDPGAQRVDTNAIRNLAFGAQGIITNGKKLSQLRMLDMPKIVYRQRAATHGFGATVEPDVGTAANASGRHRNYFIQMLLHACGVERELAMSQKIWVVKQIVRDREEFSATMLTANAGPCGPRVQKAVEKMGYILTAIGVDITDLSTLMATYQGFAKVSHYPDLFATGTVLAAAEDIDAAFYFDVAKRAYNFIYKADSENRAPIKNVFVLQPAKLREALELAAAQIPGIKSQVAREASPIPAKTRIAEILSDQLAELLDVIPRQHPTPDQVIISKLAVAREKTVELETVAQSKHLI